MCWHLVCLYQYRLLFILLFLHLLSSALLISCWCSKRVAKMESGKSTDRSARRVHTRSTSPAAPISSKPVPSKKQTFKKNPSESDSSFLELSQTTAQKTKKSSSKKKEGETVVPRQGSNRMLRSSSAVGEHLAPLVVPRSSPPPLHRDLVLEKHAAENDAVEKDTVERDADGSGIDASTSAKPFEKPARRPMKETTDLNTKKRKAAEDSSKSKPGSSTSKSGLSKKSRSSKKTTTTTTQDFLLNIENVTSSRLTMPRKVSGGIFRRSRSGTSDSALGGTSTLLPNSDCFQAKITLLTVGDLKFSKIDSLAQTPVSRSSTSKLPAPAITAPDPVPAPVFKTEPEAEFKEELLRPSTVSVFEPVQEHAPPSSPVIKSEQRLQPVSVPTVHREVPAREEVPTREREGISQSLAEILDTAKKCIMSPASSPRWQPVNRPQYENRVSEERQAEEAPEFYDEYSNDVLSTPDYGRQDRSSSHLVTYSPAEVSLPLLEEFWDKSLTRYQPDHPRHHRPQQQYFYQPLPDFGYYGSDSDQFAMTLAPGTPRLAADPVMDAANSSYLYSDGVYGNQEQSIASLERDLGLAPPIPTGEVYVPHISPSEVIEGPPKMRRHRLS
ncbi:hypothetical protein BZA70DRAFT_272787 [Myxozyma melibiosi]|uniref:Uncharacterized protein n=1 Tax=Myxozyma melibiosi TaxID=54550 RepID=A0ABR1FDY4_9ASCO